MALDLCGQKSFFAARQGLLDFAAVSAVADLRNRIQQLLLTAEYVLKSETEIVDAIPHLVHAIQHGIDMLSDVFF